MKKSPTAKGLSELQQRAKAANVSELPVADFMVPPEVTILDGSKIQSAVQTLVTHKLSGAPVVDKSGRLVGMISEYDLMLQAATKDLSETIQYSKEVISLQPTATLKECIVTLYKQRIRRIPVIDRNRRVMGIVSRIDVLKRLIGVKSS